MKKKKSEVERYFDQYAKDYTYDDLPPGAMRFADDITWHFIVKYLPKNLNAKILDAGAGEGYWTQKLIEIGYKNIILFDISEGMLNEAKKRLSKINFEVNLRYIKGDITNIKDLEKNTFDYVFSQYDAVSYSLQPKLAMKELARVAKKNSHIVVSLDSKYSRVLELIEAEQITELKKLLYTNISNEMGFPTYNLTWEELAECFEEAGLRVLEVVGAPVFMHLVNEEISEKLELDSKIRDELLKIELENCTNKSLVNFAGHLQIIGKKE
ncbi:MAG: class I SAM-dependent methyltransferase [Promethearchaeota archaeon]